MSATEAVSLPETIEDRKVIFKARGLVQVFGRVVALDACDLDLYQGEVLAVIGDNGAGKSSLIKCLSGANIPDEGTIELDGQRVDFKRPQDAQDAGVETVYQTLAVSPALDIATNMYLGRELRKPGVLGKVFRLLDGKRMRQEAEKNVKSLGISTLQNVGQPVETLSGGQRQAVAVARAAAFGSKVIILDEADAMTTDAQLALRGVMEEFSSHCTFIMTCNYKSKLLEALHSRSTVIDFKLEPADKPVMAMQFFKRLEMILTENDVTYEKAVLAKIVEKYFPDYRRTLNELQSLAVNGVIDAGTLAQVTSIKKLSDLLKALKEKDFGAMRKWVVQNSDIDASQVFRKIYDNLHEVLQPISIPQAVVIIAKYQYQAAFVADQEINQVACLTEIMVECLFQ